MSRSPSHSERQPHAERIRLPEVMRLTGLPRSTIYSLRGRGLFPSQAPKPPGTRSAYWYRADVIAWAARGQPRKLRAGAQVEKHGSPHVLDGRPSPHDRNRPLKRIVDSPEKGDPDTEHPMALSGLIRTGMQIFGQNVYRHRKSGLLLLAIGYWPAQLAPSMETEDTSRVLQ